MNYKIGLWPGFGYTLEEFKVSDAYNEIDALEKLVAELTETGEGEGYLWRKVEEDDEVDEVEEGWVYIDATMEGASFPVYLRIENMKIEKIQVAIKR